MTSALLILAHVGYTTGHLMGEYFLGEALGVGWVVFEFQSSSFVKK